MGVILMQLQINLITFSWDMWHLLFLGQIILTSRCPYLINFTRATETYLTERFVTALEAEPQVYRRILNTSFF